MDGSGGGGLVPSLLFTSWSLRSDPGDVFLALEDSFLNASEARVCPGKEARVVIWNDEVSLLSALLATCSGWRVCDVISSCSCTSWRGDPAALEARFARGEKGDFHLGTSCFCVGIFLGFSQGLWKVARRIRYCLREASPDWWIFICFGIRILVNLSQN